MQKDTGRFSRATFPSECHYSGGFLADTLELGRGATAPLWHVLGRFKMEFRSMRAEPSTALDPHCSRDEFHIGTINQSYAHCQVGQLPVWLDWS